MSELTGVLEPALSAVGELLALDKVEVALVVVGGATLNLLGLIDRTTQDVAAVDQSVRSVHAQDLLALKPSAEELEEAAAWVVTQDASDSFPRLVGEVVEHVRKHRRDR